MCAGTPAYVDDKGVARLNVLELQRIMRTMPKPVIALVNGYAIGGGHVLHVICDLSLASENAVFGQTGPVVGSFDGGLGASYLASIVGQKKAREIWYLCRQYSAQEALEMGLVNKVLPTVEALEKEGVDWAQDILRKSPIAIRFLKAGFNADLDGQTRLAGPGRRRHHALLHDGRGQGGPGRFQREAQTGLPSVPLGGRKGGESPSRTYSHS